MFRSGGRHLFGDLDDRLLGGGGRDAQFWGDGEDWLDGGSGNDIFVLGPGRTVIADFTVHGGGQIDISRPRRGSPPGATGAAIPSSGRGSTC